MPSLSLDIIVLPTYNVYTMAVVDNSTYPTDPPSVTSPTLQVNVPSFGTVYLDFTVEETNVINSTDLGITEEGSELPIPDGVYYLKYTVNPAVTYYVEKTILRVDNLMEKFDKVFMRLDMMECDAAIRKQAKVELNSVYVLIQGAIAAANNCATVQSEKLYEQASIMLDNMLSNNCGCSGTNYVITFG